MSNWFSPWNVNFRVLTATLPGKYNWIHLTSVFTKPWLNSETQVKLKAHRQRMIFPSNWLVRCDAKRQLQGIQIDHTPYEEKKYIHMLLPQTLTTDLCSHLFVHIHKMQSNMKISQKYKLKEWLIERVNDLCHPLLPYSFHPFPPQLPFPILYHFYPHL